MTANPPLPRIDEHTTIVAASVDETWQALLDTVADTFTGRHAALYARLVGCADTAASTPPIVEGSTVPGFNVSRFVPGRTLELTGRHRFSEYRLALRLEPAGPGRTRLSAETRAEFPGLTGGLYRLLVIGTRFHVLAVRRILAGVVRRVPPRSSLTGSLGRRADDENPTAATVATKRCRSAM